jgi:hypothetical protein
MVEKLDERNSPRTGAHRIGLPLNKQDGYRGAIPVG